MTDKLNIREYFPLGKAHGMAFCNRYEETKWLLGNIEASKHSLLVGPRRFGKSSLAEKAIETGKYPVTILNFNMCSDENDVENLIRHGVINLIGKALGSIEKSIHLIKNFVTNFTPKISLGTENLGATLELGSKGSVSPALFVEEALALLEKLLASKKKRAVLLFDEFQMVGLIAKGSGVEAAIRNCAQEMKYLSIIFSGSSRRLLTSMFEDERRPLYKLCRKHFLKRIDNLHYDKHINQAALLAWGNKLNQTVFEKIMFLSDRHPYYVNYLCDIIWTSNLKPPKVQDVDRAWKVVFEEEKSDANAEVAQLSLGQKKVLKYIANYSDHDLTAMKVFKIISMPPSSISSSLSTLIEKDIIEEENHQYKIINPIIKCLLQENIAVE